jgi:hypothetical protein
VYWRLAPAIVLLSAVTPIAARAQVNIDQDKTPAHIFASDCAVCHKSTRGLANGRGSSELTGFLSEHYTSSKQEAAAVAAYVLAGGGAVGKPAPAREQNSAADGDNGSAEKPKEPKEPKSREARRSGKPEEEPAAAAKPGRSASDRTKHERGQRTATAEPGGVGAEAKPPAEHREPARAHGRQKPAEAAPSTPPAPAAPEPQPAAVAAAPPPAEPAKPENAAPPAPSAATPQQAEPAAAPAGERDNIPD